MPRDTYQVRLYGYDSTEGYEVVYKSLLSAEDARSLWHNLYESHRLPNLQIRGRWKRMRKSQPGTMYST